MSATSSLQFRKLGVIGYYFGVFVFAVVSVVPILWAFSTSIKPLNEVRVWPPYWIPKEPYWRTYREVFETRPFLSYMRNSLIVASATTAICVLLGGLGGYSLSRARFRAKWALAITILGMRLFPPIALVTPWFQLASRFGILDQYVTLIAAYVYMNLPFVIWIMMGFFDEVPQEIDEAGMVDGCTKWQLLRRVIAPLAGPGLATASIFAFLLSWNEYVLAAVLSFSERCKTLPVGVMEFIGDEFVAWNQLCAGALIASIPAFIFVLAFQKYIVRGLMAGAVKG